MSILPPLFRPQQSANHDQTDNALDRLITLGHIDVDVLFQEICAIVCVYVCDCEGEKGWSIRVIDEGGGDVLEEEEKED